MFTFKIDIGSFASPVVGNGYVDCNPIKSNAVYKKRRDDKYKRVVREFIEGKLIFYNVPNGSNEYNALKTLEESGELYVPIKCYYDGSLKLTGRLDLYGFWDENKKVCELAIQTEDQYSIIFANLDKEIDIKGALATTVKTNINSTIITQESPTCTTRPPNEEKDFLFGDDADLWIYSSSDSTGCSGGATRHIFKSSAVNWAAPGYRYSNLTSLYQKATTVSELIQAPYDRFRKMVDVLNYIFDITDNSISAVESTISDYFNNDDTEMKYLFIADKSDVKRYDSDTEAAFEYIKISEFFDLYKHLSNLDWYIDGGEFKLAYPSILQLPDLETYPEHDFREKYYVNLQRYEYDINSLVNREEWSFEKSNSADFNPQSITYDTLTENYTQYNSSLVNTDFGYVTTNPDDVSDGGFVIVATEKDLSNYYIINKAGQLALTTQINGKLAITNIILDHMINADRPFSKGEFLGEEKTLSTKGIKKIGYANVPIYNPDLIDFNYAIRSELGNIEPTELEIDISLRSFSKFTGFVLPLGLPVVLTLSIKNETSSSADVNCEVQTDNGYEVTERGIVYSINTNPTIEDNKIQSGTGTGTYSIEINGLDQSTVYYVRAYATNENGTSYGSELNFSTLGTIPTVTTDLISDINPLDANVYGTVISDGGSEITQRGICYLATESVPPFPDVNDEIEIVFGTTGSFNAIIDVDYETKYYVRAYAINDVGISYGNILNFTSGDARDLWLINNITTEIIDDQVNFSCRSRNQVSISIKFSIYINSAWISETESVGVGFFQLVESTVFNPLGTPIPSGTQYKIEVIYDGNTYLEDSGTL